MPENIRVVLHNWRDKKTIQLSKWSMENADRFGSLLAVARSRISPVVPVDFTWYFFYSTLHGYGHIWAYFDCSSSTFVSFQQLWNFVFAQSNHRWNTGYFIKIQCVNVIDVIGFQIKKIEQLLETFLYFSVRISWKNFSSCVNPMNKEEDEEKEETKTNENVLIYWQWILLLFEVHLTLLFNWIGAICDTSFVFQYRYSWQFALHLFIIDYKSNHCITDICWLLTE